jgi:uncharacterized protein (DUF433 family)
MTELTKRTVHDPNVLGGKPTLRGTRVSVELVLEKLAQGAQPAEIVDDFPFLDLADIHAALWYSVHVLRDELDYFQRSA